MLNAKLCCVIACWTLCTHAFSETLIFVGSHFPSILETSDKGQIQGLGADIAQRISTNLGYESVIHVMPWQRAQEMIKQGNAHILIGPYKTPERETFMTFSRYGFYQDNMVFYSRINDPVKWRGDLTELLHTPIGVTRGWSYGKAFDHLYQKMNLQVVNNVKTNFEKLLHERIVLVATHQRNAIKVINELNIKEKVKELRPPIVVNTGYFGFSKRHNQADLVERFNNEYERLIQNGVITQLNARYSLYFERHSSASFD